MSGREGQPPGPLGIQVLLTQAGEMVDRGEAGRHGSCRSDVGLVMAGLRTLRLFRQWGAIPLKLGGMVTDSCRSGSRNQIGPDSPIEMGGDILPVVPPVSRAGKHGRGCGLPEGIGCPR